MLYKGAGDWGSFRNNCRCFPISNVLYYSSMEPKVLSRKAVLLVKMELRNLCFAMSRTVS
jgi:hypothetical protein